MQCKFVRVFSSSKLMQILAFIASKTNHRKDVLKKACERKNWTLDVWKWKHTHEIESMTKMSCCLYPFTTASKSLFTCFLQRMATPDFTMEGEDEETKREVYYETLAEKVPPEFRDYDFDKLIRNCMEVEHFRKFLGKAHGNIFANSQRWFISNPWFIFSPCGKISMNKINVIQCIQ